MVVEMKRSSSGVHSARRAARCWKRRAVGRAANADADADADRERVGRGGEDARWAAMLAEGSKAERRGEGAGVGGETTGM